MTLSIPGFRQRRDARLFTTVASLLEAGLQPRVVFTQAGVRRALTSNEASALDRVLARGGSVADALGESGFSISAVSRVRASEMAGRLTTGLRALAVEYERNVAALHRALSRLAYPVFVLHFAALARGITCGLFTGNSAGGIAAALALAMPVDIGLTLLYLTFRNAARGGVMAEYAVKIPGLGALVGDAALLPFLRTLSDLHDSGVALDKAVSIAAEPSPRFFREPMESVAHVVRGGGPLVPALGKLNAFDATTLSILQPAEVSGTLSEGLTRAANLVETRLDRNLAIACKVPGAVCYALAVGVVVWTLLTFYASIFSSASYLTR